MDSKNKPAVLLEYYLKRLKLVTMLKEYAAVAEVCGQERTDYLNFLLRLAEREVLRREERAAERRIIAANFPVIKVIDTFDFKAQLSINEPLIRDIAQLIEHDQFEAPQLFLQSLQAPLVLAFHQLGDQIHHGIEPDLAAL